MLFPTRQRRLSTRVRLTFLFVVGASLELLQTSVAQAAQKIEFMPGFMRQDGARGADAAELALANLSNEHSLAPGRYRVTLVVNLNYFDEREIDFVLDATQQQLLPCLSFELLEQIGVRLDSLAEQQEPGSACIDLLRLIPGAQINFDSGNLALALSIPQIAMRRDVIGYIDPARWDSGINAAFINYQVSAQQGSSRYRGSTSRDDLYLTSGVNVGAWRLRSSQSLRQNPEGQREWTRAYTYVQRDLPGTHANLTLGETFTSGDVFKSLPIQGMVIASDLSMLPDALQGYAPIIRGVAQSRAKLEILQNGYPVYATYVSPGPYEITDLNISGGSGELEIILTEDDGQVRRFTQPYSTLGNLLRDGVWRYSTSVGRYNAAHLADDPMLIQGTLAMGTAWDFTLYGGVMAGDFYRAGNIGIARNLGALGALAMDVTRSAADINNLATRSVDGTSYAIKYGKAFHTDTSLRFAGYRYSTEGYRDFDEVVRERNRDSTFLGSRRSRLEASVFQNLGSTSSLSMTLSQEDYWNSDYQQRQFQFNFNKQYKGVSYSLFASQSLRDDNNEQDRQFGLSVSFPLDLGHSNSVTLSARQNDGQHGQTARMTGSIDEHRLNYSASLNNDDNREQSGSLSASYQAPFASVGAGVTQGNDYRNVSLNASGAVLLHADGIELGPHLSDTAALIEVAGIAGVGVANAAGVKTNERGIALVPYMRPYRVNHLTLQTDDLGPDVEIDNGTAQVVPRRGAVVKTTFTARRVSRLAITGTTADGLPLPFGAQVSDAQGAVLGIIGQGGQVLLSVSDEPGTLDVRWGEDTEQHCQLLLEPESATQSQGYRLQSLTCR